MTIPITREDFLAMYFGRGTLAQAGAILNLTEEEMGAALLEAAFNKADRVARDRMDRTVAEFAPPLPDKVWCSQCDRQVKRREALACWSKFCAAKCEVVEAA